MAPITAIREADLDGNPNTLKDENWLPLIVTPAYPDWSSGSNNVHGAMTRTARLFFGGDSMNFTLTSNTSPILLPPPNNVRAYRRFSQLTADVVDARIWEGIHFRSSDVRGRDQGEFAAKRAFNCFLRPIHGDDDDDDDDGGDCNDGDDDD